jgi:hypothetical protein
VLIFLGRNSTLFRAATGTEGKKRSAEAGLWT